MLLIFLILTGWRFSTADEKLPGVNVTPDPEHPDFTHLRQIYFSVDPDYKGRFTVPVLYDKKTKRVVSNEVCPVFHIFPFPFPISYCSSSFYSF